MSSWVYLECLNHDPALMADDESGQHLYDLPRIRDEIANRDRLIAEYNETGLPDNEPWDADRYFSRNTARFLAKHPKCVVGIRDEYGNPHRLTEED